MAWDTLFPEVTFNIRAAQNTDSDRLMNRKGEQIQNKNVPYCLMEKFGLNS